MKYLKIIATIFFTLLAVFFIVVFVYCHDYLGKFNFIKPRLKIPEIQVLTDYDKDNLNDQKDILQGAKSQIGITINYEDAYYDGAYPPEDTGTCSDVIWRALMSAGFDLKQLIDSDIKNNEDLYPRVNGAPDPNIDFRRVLNLNVFFQRHAQILTTEIYPWNEKNLYQWQGGDIIVWDKEPGSDKRLHIGIISDKRRRDGVPYVIHNACCGVKENDVMLLWPSRIIGHYRFP